MGGEALCRLSGRRGGHLHFVLPPDGGAWHPPPARPEEGGTGGKPQRGIRGRYGAVSTVAGPLPQEHGDGPV